jgi:hypothetical protein
MIMVALWQRSATRTRAIIRHGASHGFVHVERLARDSEDLRAFGDR